MILSKRPEVERFLSAPDPGVRVAAVWGRDRGVVRERADALAARIARDPNDPFDVAFLSETDLDADAARLEAELSALSMLGGRRLVRLRLTAEKPAHDRAAAEALKRHAAGELNPDAFFLVEAGALGRDSALRKAAESAKSAVSIPCYEDETGDLARMTREALRAGRVSLSADALEVFVGRLPKDRGVARSEIERLILYVGPGSDRTLEADDLQAFLGVEPEASLFDAAFDAFGARAAVAQAGLRRAFAEGETGPAAVRAAGLHLSRLRRVLALSRSGADMKEAAKSAGVFWKQEREFLRQARAWTLHERDLVQPDVAETDRACNQAGAPDLLLAERLLMSVALRARRLGL